MARREDDPRGEDGTGRHGTDAYAAVAGWYQQFLGREGAPEEINGWLNSGLDLGGIQRAIQDSDEAKARTAAPAEPPAAPAPTTTAPSGPSTGGMPAGLPRDFFTQAFPGTFTPPQTGTPSWWTKPPDFTPPSFKAPTLAEAMEDPGYQFAAKEGQNALERSAAARGLLGTGGTLKDILSWGGNYAQQRYSDVFGRAKDVYAQNYQRALDMYQPQLYGWGTQMQATQRGGEFDMNQAWQKYLSDYNIFRNRQNDIWNRTYQATTL